ncbi:serine/threonine-protein kinase [Mycolicibacterium goodii]|uniref:non-specific serine/threonine protein kinase n=1 Tax=Mycolicibacterium goodii TaxID=134601 RepID=A0A0K0WZN5_MYCGD|nr:protein kinase [Mycolicibacterium goodii]
MPLNTGDVFAGYTIARLLGTGGMGEVYLARHPRLPRHDALKILPASLTGDAQYRQRFNREADIAAGLWHPHIVGLHDRGEFDGQLWIAMDYVDGTDAARLVRDHHPTGLPPDAAVEIVTAIAEALDYAHTRGLLHRDVKPANVLLTDPAAARRRILLADFGVARRVDDISGLTATNMAVGSMAYSPPEQLLGQDLDGRADQYALAATAFHLLAGRSPFHHSNAAVVISKHLSEPPPRLGDSRPDLARLDAVMVKGLAKDPAARYPTCGAFAAALADAARPPAPQAPPPALAEAARPPQQPRRPIVTPQPPPPVPLAAPTQWAAPPQSAGLQPRPRQKRSAATVVAPLVLAVLFLAATVFAVSQFARSTPAADDATQWQPYVDSAKTFALNLVTVNADTVDADVERVLDGATGEFRDGLQRGAAKMKKDTADEGKHTEAVVTGAGVESFSSDEAVVLVTLTTKTTNNTRQPREDALQRLAVTVVDTGGDYKVSKLEFID